jgi:hypothetical protein
MDNTIEIKKSKRGIFLWIMIALSILISVQRLITLLFPATFVHTYAGGPSWSYGFNFLAFLIEVVGILGIVLWRKWGVFLIAIIYVAETLVSYTYFNPRISVLSVLVNAIFLFCLMWAVKRKWVFFH